MPTVEVDHAAVVRVVLGYLRDLNCIRAMRCLEEETGLVQGEYGKDLLFLRNLVLDGRWEDAQAFVKPFAAKPAAAEAGFDVGKVMFALRRQKFLELLGGGEARPEVMELVDGLKQLEPHCSKEEFNNLCYCLTLTTLTEHPEYRDWTPHIGRMQCFQTIRPYFEAVLARQWVDSESSRTPVGSGQLLKLLGQAASMQVVNYVREHPGSAGPYHLKFDVYKSSVDAAQMVKRDGARSDPPSAVLLAAQEWQRANVTAKPLPSRGGMRAAGAGDKLHQSAAGPSWNGAASAGPMGGGMDPLLGTMPRDPGARPQRVRVRQRNPALARSMAGVVEDPRKTQVYQGLVGSGVAAALHMDGVYGADGGRGRDASGGAAVASAVRAAGTNAAPLSADEINTVRDLLRRSMSSDALRVHKQEAAAVADDASAAYGDDATDDGAGNGAGRGSASGSPARAGQRPKAVQWEISWSPDQGAPKEPPKSFADRMRDSPEPEPEPAPRGRRHPPAPPPARASPGRVRVTRPKGWSSPQQRSQSAARVRPAERGSPSGGGRRMGGLVGGGPPSAASPRRTSSSSSLRSPGGSGGRDRGGMRRSRSKSALRGSRHGSEDHRDDAGGAERGVHFAPNPVDLGPRPGSGSRSRGQGAGGGRGGGAGRRGRDAEQGASGGAPARKVRHTHTALWDDSVVQSIKPQGVMPDTQPIRAIAFDPTGAHLVVGTNSRTLRVCAAPVPLASRAAMTKAKLDAARPAYVGKLHTEFEWPGHHLGSLYCVAWSDDGHLIASGSNDTSVKVVRAVTWEDDEAADDPGPVATFKPNSGTVRDVVFLPSGRSTPLVLSAGGGDCAIRCWHMHREPEPLSVLSGHSGVVFTVAPCSEDRLLSGSADGTACLWDLRTAEASLTLPPCNSGEVHAVHANPAGEEAAVGYVDGVVQVWDLRGNRVRASSTLHSADCRSVHYSPEGSCILTASFDGTVSVLRETPGGRGGESHLDAVAVFRDHTDRVLQARWHPKSPAFATASADKTVLFWSVGVEKRR